MSDYGCRGPLNRGLEGELTSDAFVKEKHLCCPGEVYAVVIYKLYSFEKIPHKEC